MISIVQPDPSDEKRLRRRIKRATVIFALTAFLATAGFFSVVQYQQEVAHVGFEAAKSADLISLRIAEFPESWKDDIEWLDRMAHAPHTDGRDAWYEIVDERGRLVASGGKAPGLISVTGSAELNDGSKVVGVIRVVEFPDSLLRAIATGLPLGILLSACVVLLVWILPVRALDAAFRRVELYREALEDRVSELEMTKEQLERQGAELARTAENLYEARELERRANQAKSTFLANMSHELRTPLNSIIGFSEMMKLQAVGPMGNDRYLEYADHIHSSGAHLLELINDMLDLSKVEAGRLELDEEVVEIGALYKGCRKLLEHRISEGGLSHHVVMAPGPMYLIADKRKLRQIIFNLLSNAIKFTPEGGRVVTQVHADAQSGFTLSISDTGIGMQPEDIPRALEPFGQVDNPLVRNHVGTGLGLSLTKALVELHGGSITLSSRPAEGTIATVRLPAGRIVQNDSVARRASA